MVRHRLPGDAERVGEVGGVPGCFSQREQDAGAGGIGERVPEAGDGCRMGEGGESGGHASTVQKNLNSRNDEFSERGGARSRLPDRDQWIAYTALPTMTATMVVQPMIARACQKRMRALPMPDAASIVAVNCVGSSRGPSRLTPGTP